MAIIYTYPQINSSSDLAASDLMIISDMSANGRPTKSLKLSDLATFITNTGTGSGTTNKITKWTDGASGVLGDSSITDAGGQVSMSTDFTVLNPTEVSGGYSKLITDWGDHRISILDTLGAYTFTAADLDGGGKIGVNKQSPSTTLHVGGTGTFDSSLSIPLIPTANAHATSKQYVDQQIASIPAGLVFQGNWNASTNTPTLASGVGTVGNYYVVSVAGNTNLDGITDWEVGDWAVFVEVGGVDKWDKIDQTFVQGAGATGQVSFWNGVNSVTGDNDFYWDNVNKRLGIGTNSPGVPLDVFGADGIRTATNSGALAAGYFARLHSDYGSNALRLKSRAGDVFRATDFGQAVSILTGTTSSGTSERMRITSGGNVGIGTSTPSTLLHIAGANPEFRMTDSSNINYNSIKNVDGNMILSADTGNQFGNSRIRFEVDGSEKMRLDTNGNLGIGTTSPSEKLSLPDNAKIGLGDSADLQIQHNSTDSFIENNTGNLNIANYANDKDIRFFCDDGAGGITTYFQLDGGQSQTRVFKNFKFEDNVKALFGTSDDLQIFHDSTDSYISDTGTGDLIIQGSNDVWIKESTNNLARFNGQGVKLYYLNVSKLETVANGAKIPQAGDGLQLVSPNGTTYTVTVDNSGNLVVT